MRSLQIDVSSIDAASRALLLRQVRSHEEPNPADSRRLVESHSPQLAEPVVRCSASARQFRAVKSKEWLTDEEVCLYEDAAQELAASHLRIECNNQATFLCRPSPPRNARPDCQLCPPIYDTYTNIALVDRAGWAERSLTMTRSTQALVGASHALAGADLVPLSPQGVAALNDTQREHADNHLDEEHQCGLLLQGALLLDSRCPEAAFSESLQHPRVVRPWDRREDNIVSASNFRDVVFAPAAIPFIAQRDSSTAAPPQPTVPLAPRSVPAVAAMQLVASEASRVIPTVASTADGEARARRTSAATVVTSSHRATTRSNIVGSSASTATAAAIIVDPAIPAFRPRFGTIAGGVAVTNAQIIRASAATHVGAAKLSSDPPSATLAIQKTTAAVRPLRGQPSSKCSYSSSVASATIVDAFRCSICSDTCVDPASTPCGHNFCLVHLRKWIRTKAPNASCPDCRARIQQREADVCINTAIKGVVVAAQRVHAVQQQRMQMHGYVPPS